MTALLALTEVALALAVWRAFQGGPLGGSVRAAMFALWVSSGAALVLDGRAEWGGALAPTLLVFAVRSGPQAWLAAAAAFLVRFDLHGLFDAAAVLTGAWLAEGVRLQRHRTARLIAWSASLFGFLFVLLPSTLHRLRPEALFTARPLAGLGLCCLGLVLGATAARSLVAGGGTPDPLDPPHVWCTSGLYRWVDHPLQYAELLIAAAALLLWPSPYVALGGVVFALILLGPVRVYEYSRARVMRTGTRSPGKGRTLAEASARSITPATSSLTSVE